MSIGCTQIKVGWIHVRPDNDDNDVRGSRADRPISVSFWHRGGDRGFSTYEVSLYRDEALELGRALVAAASTHVSEKNGVKE